MTIVPFWRVRDGIFYGLFYCVTGSFLNKHIDKFNDLINKLPNKKYISSIIFLFIIMICERFMYLLIFKKSGNYFLSTIPLTILILGFCLKNTTLFKDTFISKLGQYTLGIYLIHPLIIDIVSLILSKLNLSWISSNIIWQLIYGPVLLLLSYKTYKFFKTLKGMINSY